MTLVFSDAAKSLVVRMPHDRKRYVKVKLHCHRSNVGFRNSSLLVCLFLLSACATPGVTQGTGRVIDPPLELILYCLLNPTAAACRGIFR